MTKKDVKTNLLNHSEAKVRLLGEYLKRYLNIICNDRYTQRVKIYDLFCGEGMNDNPQHVFQVLTKRAERLFELHKQLKWTHNIWMGVSVENQKVIDRIDFLRKTKAKVKFLSLEPLIGALPNLNLKKIDWVIVGGESGHKARYMNPDWVLDIQEQCENADVAFFFKQWGGRNKKATGRLLNGRTYDEMPEIMEIEKEAR